MSKYRFFAELSRVACLFMFVLVSASSAVAGMPSPNSELIATGGIFFYNGQGQACHVSFNQTIVAHQSTSPVGLPYYPSLDDFGIVNNGPCQNGLSVLPAGEFLLGDGSVYYSNGGGQACKYSNVPSWINISNLSVYPVFPSDLASDGGICAGWEGPNQYPVGSAPEPNTKFISQGGFYFYNGIGHSCQITYNMAVRDHWDLSHIGMPYYPSLQQIGVVNDGICNPAGQLLSDGAFLTSEGSVYYANGQGHACKYSFAGGIDTIGLTMYPSFPFELAQYDGSCGSSPFLDAKAEGMDATGSITAAHANSLILKGLLSGGSPSIYFRAGNYTLESPSTDSVGNVFTLRLPSNANLSGDGTLIGIGTQAAPTVIDIKGSIDAPLSLASAPILGNTTTLSLDNDNHQGGTVVHAGDLIQLNNFPTDDVADQCTIVISNGVPTRCDYPQNATGALRSYRRRELLEASAVNQVSISTTTGTLNSYPTELGGRSTYANWKGASGYAFVSVIHPTENVLVKGIGLQHMYIRSEYARNLRFQNVSADRSTLAAATCYQCSVSFFDFDAGQEDQEVNFYEGSQTIEVQGHFHGGTCPSDCGTIKLDQVRDAHVAGTFGGGPVTPAPLHSIMVDTNFAEDLSGFSNGPVSGITIEADSSPAGYANAPEIFLTGVPWVDVFLSNVSIHSNGISLHFSGANTTDVVGSGTGALAISRSRSISIAGGVYQNVKIDSDGPGGSYQSQDVELTDLILQEIPTTAGDDPWAQIFDTNNVSLNSVTVDVSQAPPASSINLIQFKNVDGLTINNLKVRCSAGQSGLQLWADVGVTNFTAVGGTSTLPVPFPRIVASGQTGNTSCPTP